MIFGINELLFLGLAIFLFSMNLVALRLGRGYLLAMIAIATVLMNIAVTKQYNLFGLAATGGNALYGATFLLTDLLNEHHGRKAALQGVIVGFMAMLVFVIVTQVLLLIPANSEDFAQSSLVTLFTLTPRIVLGSLIAFAIAQSLDVYLFTKLKQATNGKLLWLRNNASTLISQAIDTLIFTFIGLTTFTVFGNTVEGFIGLDIFWQVALVTYLIKIIVSLLDTPFIYLSYLVKK